MNVVEGDLAMHTVSLAGRRGSLGSVNLLYIRGLGDGGLVTMRVENPMDGRL